MKTEFKLLIFFTSGLIMGLILSLAEGFNYFARDLGLALIITSTGCITVTLINFRTKENTEGTE